MSNDMTDNKIFEDSFDSAEEFHMDENKPRSISGSLRQETELFDDDKYVPHDIISVKYISLPKSGENWQIIKNKNIVMTIKGIRFTSKERQFLKTANGMRFIIDGYKNNWSTSEFKRQLKLRKLVK